MIQDHDSMKISLKGFSAITPTIPQPQGGMALQIGSLIGSKNPAGPLEKLSILLGACNFGDDNCPTSYPVTDPSN